MKTYSICLAILMTSARTYAADAGCTPIFDAVKKGIITPNHLYSSRTAGFRPNQTDLNEAIYTGGTGGSIFVKVKGRWSRSPSTPGEALKQKEENIRNSKNTCRYLRDEGVSGETAGVYTVHSDTEDGTTDVTIWIAKGRGLPLKEEIDLDVGGGAIGKSHVSNRYEYSNVRPPEGVN